MRAKTILILLLSVSTASAATVDIKMILNTSGGDSVVASAPTEVGSGSFPYWYGASSPSGAFTLPVVVNYLDFDDYNPIIFYGTTIAGPATAYVSSTNFPGAIPLYLQPDGYQYPLVTTQYTGVFYGYGAPAYGTFNVEPEPPVFDRKMYYDTNAYASAVVMPNAGVAVDPSSPIYYGTSKQTGTFTLPISIDDPGGTGDYATEFYSATWSPYSANGPVAYISTVSFLGSKPVYLTTNMYGASIISKTEQGTLYGYAASQYGSTTSTCTSPRTFPVTNPSVATGTKISATHFANLMSNINYLREDAGLGACGWTQGSAPTGRKIHASDINDLRACLAQVYTTCSGTCGPTGGCSTFNVTATAGTSKILATDIQRLVTGINSAP